MLTIFQTLFSPPRHLILLILAAWLGLLLSEKRIPRGDPLRNSIGNLIFYGLFAFILGGRIFYAAAHFPAFAASPASLFSPNVDLFEPFGGAFAAIVASLVYGRLKKLGFWTTLDALTPFFATLAVGLGLSHLAAGTHFGRPSEMPWAIEMWNQRRHPSQIYEVLASLAILGLLMLQKPARPAGILFLAFASLTAGIDLFLGAFRGDSTLLAGGFRQGQITDWFLMAFSFVALEIRIGSAHHPPDSSPSE